MSGGRNIWTTLQGEVHGGPLALYLFVLGVVAFIIGAVLSVEDAVSSYRGLQMLETTFGVNVVSYDVVLYVMAITPWVGQIVFFGLWSLDTSRKWALITAIVWFVLDFISDVQYRSAAQLFPLDGSGINPQSWDTILVSAGMTFLFFTVGAELFITAATAITVALFADAISEYARMRLAVREAFAKADDTLRPDKKKNNSQGGGGNAHNNGGQSNNRNNNRREQQRAEPPVINASDLMSEEDMLSMFANVPAGREVRQRQGNRNP